MCFSCTWGLSVKCWASGRGICMSLPSVRRGSLVGSHWTKLMNRKWQGHSVPSGVWAPGGGGRKKKKESPWIHCWSNIVAGLSSCQSPSKCTTDMWTGGAGRSYPNISVLFPYLCSQSRYIIKTLNLTEDLRTAKYPCRKLLFSFLSLNPTLKGFYVIAFTN